MKKIVFSLIVGFLLGSVSVSAQELTQSRKVATFAPGLVSNPVAVGGTQRNIQRQLPKYARTTILRFEPGQIELTGIQKELLLRIADRLAERPGTSLTVTVASTNFDDSGKRAIAIETFLRSYVRQFRYIVRYVRPENVVGSVNNTVKIEEKR